MRLNILCLLVFLITSCNGYARVVNIKCYLLDPAQFKIVFCGMKDLGQGKSGANVQFNVLQPENKNWMVNYSILKNHTGFQPVFYDITFDFCRFMKNPSRLELYYIFHQAILPYSNLNHSCPYKHDVIIKDFVLADNVFSTIPKPKGKYTYSLKIGNNAVWAINLRIYLDIDVRKSLRKHHMG